MGLGNDPVVDELLDRVATLEEQVEKLNEAIGTAEKMDPLMAATILFRSTLKSKAKAGIRPPRR